MAGGGKSEAYQVANVPKYVNEFSGPSPPRHSKVHFGLLPSAKTYSIDAL
jgi:hypothetical protein